jgi:hypothetical protein
MNKAIKIASTNKLRADEKYVERDHLEDLGVDGKIL